MDKSLIAALYQQAEEIAKETAAKLGVFSKQAAEVLYGQHNIIVDPETIQDEKVKHIAEQFLLYQQGAIAKADFAPIDKLKEAAEMKKIVEEGGERIRRLYEEGTRMHKPNTLP